MMDTMIFTILRTARNVFFDLSSKLAPDTVLPSASCETPHTSNPGISVTRRFSAKTTEEDQINCAFDDSPKNPTGVRRIRVRNTVVRKRGSIHRKAEN